jgi:two-component system OmpR family sensor kinase
VDLPEGFHAELQPKKTLPYPAFIKEKKRYLDTSCAGSDYPGKIVVVSVDGSIIDARLAALRDKIVLFMLIAFVVNIGIAMLLAWVALQPVRREHAEFIRFVDDVVHDLKAPVTVISLNLQGLQKACQNERLSRVARSVEVITNLYRNLEILLQERSKSSAVTLDLHDVSTQLVPQLQAIYPDVRFHLDIPHVSVTMNLQAFERIMYNLIGNAAKYAHETPEVWLGLKGNRFFVRDNGPGMERPEKMLERYARHDTTRGGFGLGLDIVRRLSEECGIDFEIVSKKGKGTTFWFDISPFLNRE